MKEKNRVKRAFTMFCKEPLQRQCTPWVTRVAPPSSFHRRGCILSIWASTHHSFELCLWAAVLLHEVASVVSDSFGAYGPQPTRLLCPWDSPGKNTGVMLPFPSPGDLPNPGITPASLKSPALAGGFFTTSATWDLCLSSIHFLHPFASTKVTASSVDVISAYKRFQRNALHLDIREYLHLLFARHYSRNINVPNRQLSFLIDLTFHRDIHEKWTINSKPDK